MVFLCFVGRGFMSAWLIQHSSYWCVRNAMW